MTSVKQMCTSCKLLSIRSRTGKLRTMFVRLLDPRTGELLCEHLGAEAWRASHPRGGPISAHTTPHTSTAGAGAEFGAVDYMYTSA